MSVLASSISGPSISGPARDPQAYLRIVWRWKILLLGILIAVPLGTYLFTHRQPRVYQSSTLMNIPAQAISTSLLGGGAAPVSGSAADDANVAARLVTTTGVARRAAAVLKLPASAARSLLGQVTATPDVTGFVTIAATDHDPQRAADIANAFATAVIDDRTTAALHQLDVSIAALAAQLKTVAANDPGLAQLSDQLQNLRAVRASQAGATQVIEPALASTTPISPRVLRSVVLAVIVALLLGFGAVAAAEGLDRRIRDPDDLERFTGLRLLGAIPASAFGGKPLEPPEEQAFSTLRAALTQFNIDRQISSVLVTSAQKGEGKTTVVTNLAIALARASNDVIVLDLDLRGSTAAVRLGADAPFHGLGSVLADGLPVGDALVELERPDPAGGRLRVLPAGSPPPNPSELIASPRMREVIAELSEQADVLLIDSPPLLAVSDVLPLLNVVSGVVIVARMGSTTRDALARLLTVIAAAGGGTLGVVATGASAGGLYARGYR